MGTIMKNVGSDGKIWRMLGEGVNGIDWGADDWDTGSLLRDFKTH